MSIREQLEHRLLAGLQPARMALKNDSGMHAVPKGSETHWNLIIVSDAFAGLSPLHRHRRVYDALGELMKSIHALTMKTLTPAEWDAAGGEVANPAPPCMGGSKHES